MNAERHRTEELITDMDPAPVTQELLDAATRWNAWSWVGLLGFGITAALSAIGTVAFTFVQFWSGGVIDRQAEWRTATLERETASANEAAGLANERAASAEVKTAELRKEAEVARLEQERLRQQLAWRRINQEQMNELVSSLTGITFPVTLQVLSSDPEAARFASDIETVFQAAGISYKRTSAIVMSDDVLMGLRMYGREGEINRIALPFLNLGFRIDGQLKDQDLVFHVAAKPQPQP